MSNPEYQYQHGILPNFFLKKFQKDGKIYSITKDKLLNASKYGGGINLFDSRHLDDPRMLEKEWGKHENNVVPLLKRMNEEYILTSDDKDLLEKWIKTNELKRKDIIKNKGIVRLLGHYSEHDQEYISSTAEKIRLCYFLKHLRDIESLNTGTFWREDCTWRVIKTGYPLCISTYGLIWGDNDHLYGVGREDYALYMVLDRFKYLRISHKQNLRVTSLEAVVPYQLYMAMSNRNNEFNKEFGDAELLCHPDDKDYFIFKDAEGNILP